MRATQAQSDDAVRMIEEYQDAVGVVVRDDRSDIHAYLNSSDKAMWLAYAGAEPVGCVAFRILRTPAQTGEMKRLYVRKKDRGRGIAQRLLRAIEQHAAVSRCRALLLDSKADLVAALRFYEQMGYVPCERYNDNPQATVFMRKEFASPAPK